ncbi:hypothetical protein HZY91_07545 [Facklamia sp. DSM 111018]|uniref:Uncharacterized protein n=1 Tax=Facklamia lactis TaxID=2749967 RepID=A0ABS0LTX0_9LACT|nr:hypothetical protein [Facklamia lactis]MBG9980888.1 hypothetical protein [Facklamia lactis]MBG9986749.1 hypothetical protein [Facklamia lactis]
MNNRKFDPEVLVSERRFIVTVLFIALLIQIVVAFLYYFKEAQVALLFPMILAILVTFVGLVRVWNFGK